eukprot:TRINITY_DN14228_c0_g2_i4.p1 TRINITY_DN14228_c0_g2~~TRINITY_DN14228_c0_g2_i4.p1  ORF type:complete len:125 (-),score=27.98 TRINITY_DN14228_c0_g2_i4:149-523(-)
MLSPVKIRNKPKLLTDSTFSKGTTQLLKETFELLIKTELIAENIRKKVKDTVPMLLDTFTSSDVVSKGFATREDIEEIMERNELGVEEEDVMLLMNRYDKDLNGKVTVSEVCVLLNVVYKRSSR